MTLCVSVCECVQRDGGERRGGVCVTGGGGGDACTSKSTHRGTDTKTGMCELYPFRCAGLKFILVGRHVASV